MTPIEQSGHDRLWDWFGLSYASWLTLPRVLMHQMPDEWQGRMASLLKEMDEHFPSVPGMDTAVFVREDGKFAKCPRWIEYRHPDFKTIETFKESTK